MLRINQRNAINFSKNNNFESGVHFHATGTGKSWISLELILEYHNIYPDKNILWLCEQKSILIEQFNRNTCLLYTSPSPRDRYGSRMPSSA